LWLQTRAKGLRAIAILLFNSNFSSMKKRSLKPQSAKKQLKDFAGEQIPIQQTSRIKGGDGEGEEDPNIVVVDIIIP
jgi:hypothetical protein